MLEELGPTTLVAYRLAFAIAGLIVLFIVRRKRPPRDLRIWAHLAAVSMLSPGIPFLLISWGETRIDSGMASILNGTVPLLTVVTAHFFLDDEPITARKVVGLFFGFAGIITLFSRNLTGANVQGQWLGQGAVLLAALLYALSAPYSKRLLKRVPPLSLALGQMVFADLLAWLILLGGHAPIAVPHRGLTWIALAWMGLLGSCLAFVFYHWLVTFWGASRSSLTNYLVPAVGLFLGLLVRGERADWHLGAGSVLILGGIAIVNYKALISLGKSLRHQS